MRTDALDIAKAAREPAEKGNLLREYMQAIILRSLHESRAFESLSFVGGTALRFLFSLPRFSEDLDFSLEQPERYDAEKWLAKLGRDLRFQGFESEIELNKSRTVHTAWVKIPGLLRDVGLSSRQEQKLFIKIEIDTNPPSDAVLVRKIINRYVIFGVQHHDLPSLMAGKIRALLTRPHLKGRDWFDLVWYMAHIPPIEPNRDFLASALRQGNAGDSPTPSNLDWKKTLLLKLSAVDLDAAKTDVRPFLERKEDIDLIDQESIRTMLEQR